MSIQSVRWFGRAAAAGVLALTIAAPAVQAQSRDNQSRGGDDRGITRDWRDQNQSRGDHRDQAAQGGPGDYRNQGSYSRGGDIRPGDRSTRSYRDNERVQVQGRVTSFNRERDGYRVYLDRGAQPYWVPQSYFRGAHNLRVGISVVLGGVFRGGAINVDAVNWPDDGGYYGGQYDQGYVSGVVERVNYRTGTLLLRDDRSGRAVSADFGRADRRRLQSIRPGDYLELSGGWDRGGIFEIARVETIRSRY